MSDDIGHPQMGKVKSFRTVNFIERKLIPEIVNCVRWRRQFEYPNMDLSRVE